MEEIEQKTPPGGFEAEALWTLGEVRRELQRVINGVKAGSIKPGVGGVLISGLGALARVVADSRDSLWVKRAKQMWKHYEASAQSPANH